MIYGGVQNHAIIVTVDTRRGQIPARGVRGAWCPRARPVASPLPADDRQTESH